MMSIIGTISQMVQEFDGLVQITKSGTDWLETRIQTEDPRKRIQILVAMAKELEKQYYRPVHVYSNHDHHMIIMK